MSNINSQIKQKQAQITKLTSEIADLRQQAQAQDQVRLGNAPDAQQAARLRSQKFSYEVNFERRDGTSFSSNRRFTLPKEANQHGTRFSKKHRHAGFVVVQVSKKANAWINWTTGKTNPVV